VTGAAPQGERDRLRTQIAAVEKRMSALDAELRQSFPQYFEFAMPAPLKVGDLQTLLGTTEALAQFAVVGAHAYVWVVTKTAARWARLPRTPAEIETTVAALRCGLDYEGAWSAPTRCRELVKRTYSEADSRVPKPLPFDLERAYQLHTALFGEMGDLIAGKRLLVVPSGPLSSLPLQVLVTKRPPVAVPADWTGYAAAAWLATTHPITVIPSVASLKALRAQAGQSSAPNPYVAFANPVLAGPADTKSCDQRGHVLQRSVRAPVARSVPARLYRGELAAVEKVRSLRPLAETANEVCAVARQAGATREDVFLGPLATERTVKSLSATGKLATYRVIHFATHGLLANETEVAAGGPAQPGLVLTPPATATAEDDGILTSGEIAQLKLNADWVILSACNTAGGDKTDADTLSGLARAFFYAGSRALLVSHWAVDNEATVTLITKTFETLKATPSLGRAGALRAAMLGMIATGNDPAAHPGYWAPFVVVGEGAGGRD
jgi:CHAT domain-containing protein